MRNDLLNTVLAARIEERKGYKEAQKRLKRRRRHPKSRPLCQAVLSDAVGQAKGGGLPSMVEAVVRGLIGGADLGQGPATDTRKPLLRHLRLLERVW